ncbi:MAG: S8 family serine peptidase, partial [Verrucomicrobiota bacterium]
MRLKPGIWMLLSLLLFAGGLCLWRAGDRLASSRLAPQGASAPSAPSVLSVPSANIPAAARSYRLSNTPQSAAELLRNPRAILLRNAVIDTTRPAELDIPEPLRSHGPPGSYLVQSDRPIKEFLAALQRDGAEFVSYIPNNAALVRAAAEAGRTLEADRAFQAVLPYEPYYKLDGSLLPTAVNGGPAANSQLRVTVFPGQDAAAARALAALGANVTGQEPTPFGTTFIVTAPADQLAAVAQLPQTQEIESFSPRHMLNDLTRVRLAVSTDTTALTNYLGLTGTNICVVLDDTGVDGTHRDFAPASSRLAGLLTDPDGHGTVVAGTIAGGGNESFTVTNFVPGSTTPATNLQFRGMAPQASLYVQGVDLFSGPYISDSYLQSNASYVLTAMASSNTALPTNFFINNLSWGYQSTAYDLSAASYDFATRNSQPGAPGEHGMLFVVAAGNGAGVAGSITSPGTAKNVITVGALDSPRFITNAAVIDGTTGSVFENDTEASNVVADFSSAGNVADGLDSGGRFKPDVVAPGVFTVSTRAAGFMDPTEQQVVNYNDFPGQSVSPGQSNVFAVTIMGGTTNLIIQVLPNELSPVPFPTNLQIYFDTNDPPATAPLPASQTNEAGVPAVANPAAGNGYIEVFNPATQPWPVAYDLRVYGIQTNSDYQNYYQVLSNQLNTNLLPWYRYESGTSMSAAAISGMLALVQQYLHQTNGLTPSPALLKALLINGSRPLNRRSDLNPTPGANLEGYGVPYLSNCIPTNLASGNGSGSASGSMVIYDQSPTNALQTGEWHNYTVSLAGNATNSPLRVTLVWTDPPGNPAAGFALVNNLDLVVSNTVNSNVYFGNDFQAGDIYTEASNSATSRDIFNNVENVYLDATFGLAANYTVSVQAMRVDVNAATLQTNIIGQDYALVISDDDPTTVLTVTDNGTNNAAIGTPRPILTVGNGNVILTNRVGANEPNQAEYPGNLPGSLYPYPGNTNGSLSQWQFFVFPNAAAYTNAIFATFLPETLTIPNSSPVNLSYPAANNADLDLFVSTNPALFNLDTNALAGASKSVGQGGSQTVLFTNIGSVSNFYVGVKCETQQGAEFAFFATVTTNFGGLGGLSGNGPVTVSAFNLPVVIPDSDDPEGSVGAYAIAFVASPITVRKAMVTLGAAHGNPADLYGILSHGGQTATLNHFTGAPGGFTNTYDDLPDGTPSAYPIIASDGPGTLVNFVGQSGTGQWILNERDNVLNQTGMVTMLTLTLWPQTPFSTVAGGMVDTNYINLAAYGSYYGYVDVPDDATNLNIALTTLPPGDGPFGIYLTNRETPNTGDYGISPVNPPGGALNLSVNAALNLLTPPMPAAPPLSGGRWFYDITNESDAALTNIEVVITILESVTPNLNLTVSSPNTPTPLGTDDHTLSQICVTNGIFSSNQILASLQVGVRLNDPGEDNLVLHLISPQGTSVLLMEDRGGPLATNLGLTTANSNYVYLTFTDNADLAQELAKFYPPPFGQLPVNVNAFFSSFESVAPGDYGPGAIVEGWTVVSNDVAVVTGSDLYPACDGANYLALASGVLTTTIPTVAGQAYTLTNAYRGPGLMDWWPFEGDFTDIIGTNNGTLTAGGPVTYVTGEVGQGIQFPGTGPSVNFGTNAGNFGAHDFTIDYWMNTISTNPAEAFLQKGSACDGSAGFWDIVATNGVPSLSVFDTASGQGIMTLTGALPLKDGLWHHLAWVAKGTRYSLYVDGQFNINMNVVTNYDLSNGQPLILGTNDCAPGMQPYTGAADELDLWNRALTDVEIAAIYQAGTNHIGKATPTSIFPNCQILVASGTNTITNTLIATNAGGPNWLTNTIYFTAFDSNTAITLQGNPLGMLLDYFVLQTPVNPSYVQPEEPLAPFNGQNPYGCWTLDVWDTRTDSSALTNGVLLSWNLQMTVSSTNVSLIVLANHVPDTNGIVQANGITYFAFDVPAGVNFDTNSLFNCSTNLNLLFNQTALPTGSQLGDYTLLAGVTSGAYVLTNNVPPPSLMPGARYFLGVQNTNNVPATFAIEVDTQVLANASAIIPLADAIPYTTNITSAPQYFSFAVPTNAILASFEIVNPANEVDLYARYGLPLPSNTAFDYQASYDATNDEAIVVATNSYNILGIPVTANSDPVPLTPGNWYLAVYNANTNTPVTYQVVATYITSNSITITPLNDSYAIGGTNGPGPDLTNFYSYTVINPAATGVQFVVSNMSGNVDLIARNGCLPTPQQMTDGSFNPGTNLQLITIATNALLPSLYYTTWYLGVPNNTAGPVSFLIAATALTTPPPSNFPAVRLMGMSLGAGGFTLRWSAVPGARYEVDLSSDLIHWSK